MRRTETRSITIDADELAAILRHHFDLPGHASVQQGDASFLDDVRIVWTISSDEPVSVPGGAS